MATIQSPADFDKWHGKLKGKIVMTAALQELLAGGQASGEFRADFDPQAVATAILAVVDAVPPRMARDPDFDVARYGLQIAGLFDAATRRAAPRE